MSSTSCRTRYHCPILDSGTNLLGVLRFEQALVAYNILNLRNSSGAHHDDEPYPLPLLKLREGSDLKSNPYDLLVYQKQFQP